jgi:hypothetical protein
LWKYFLVSEDFWNSLGAFLQLVNDLYQSIPGSCFSAADVVKILLILTTLLLADDTTILVTSNANSILLETPLIHSLQHINPWLMANKLINL